MHESCLPVKGKSKVPSSLAHKVVNGVLFQLGWFGAVLGGNQWALGCLFVFSCLHQTFFVRRYSEWFLVLIVAALGISIDSLLFHYSLLVQSGDGFIPLWLACLWCMFALTLCHAFSWLQGRLWLAAVLGGIAGPSSYLAGVVFSDAELGVSNLLFLIVSVFCWAITMPLYVWLAGRLVFHKSHEF